MQRITGLLYIGSWTQFDGDPFWSPTTSLASQTPQDPASPLQQSRALMLVEIRPFCPSNAACVVLSCLNMFAPGLG